MDFQKFSQWPDILGNVYFVPFTREVVNDCVPSLGHFFGGHISTFCPANTLKIEFVVHWTAERETRNTCIVSKCHFVCKFDSFPEGVLS